MNERIKELYDQALETKFDYGAGAGVKPGEYYSNYITVLNPEKFAQLIIRECMSIIKQGEGLGEEDDFDKGFQAGIAMAYNRVRTQMGVEE